jgi:hypothetical protein
VTGFILLRLDGTGPLTWPLLIAQIIWVSTEHQQIYIDREEPEDLDRNLSQCHFVHPKFRVGWLGLKRGPCGKRPASNLLSCDTTFILIYSKWFTPERKGIPLLLRSLNSWKIKISTLETLQHGIKLPRMIWGPHGDEYEYGYLFGCSSTHRPGGGSTDLGNVDNLFWSTWRYNPEDSQLLKLTCLIRKMNRPVKFRLHSCATKCFNSVKQNRLKLLQKGVFFSESIEGSRLVWDSVDLIS